MNERERDLEPYVISSEELFIRMSTNPQNYPLLIFSPNIRRPVMGYFAKTFHVIGVVFRGSPTFAMAYGYYKKMPLGAKQPEKMDNFKKQEGMDGISLPFENIVDLQDNGHFMILNNDIPEKMIRRISQIFSTAKVPYEGSLRESIYCVFFDRESSDFNEFNDPSAGHKMKVVGSWMEE